MFKVKEYIYKVQVALNSILIIFYESAHKRILLHSSQVCYTVLGISGTIFQKILSFITYETSHFLYSVISYLFQYHLAQKKLQKPLARNF